MTSNKIDYYTLLQVPKSATTQQIKKAYKKLAIKWHPDKNLDNKDEAVERFREISQAYEVLSNEQKRKKYDLYGFDGAKISSGSSTKFNFADANDLFKSFFSSYGFDNASDGSFFDAYFKAYGGGSRGGTTYYKYSTPSSDGTSSYSTYFNKPSSSQYTSYTSYSSKPSDYFTKYANSSSNNTTSSNTSSATQDNEQLPPEGQTIKKVHHVTRKFTDGTEETIQRTTIINSDGSKEITEQNLDGTNKKTYHVLGGAKKQEPKVQSNFSGYNFGRREASSTEGNTSSNPQSSDPTSATTEGASGSGTSGTSNTTYKTYTTSGTTSGTTGYPYGSYGSYGSSSTPGASYKTYYTTSTGSTGTTGYKIPNDVYANVKRAYSGGTKVYYADGTQATNPGSFSSFGSGVDMGTTGTKVYYTVRR